MEDLIKAFQIFLKYGEIKYPTACEHDVLYVVVDPSIVSEIDRKLLSELGFLCYEDDEETELSDNFHSYKYGSC